MDRMNRRRFLGGAATGVAALGAANLITTGASAEPLLILGGGPAGAQAALTLALSETEREVFLVERDPALLLGAAQKPALFSKPTISAAYRRLTDTGVRIVLDEAVSINWKAARAELLSGRRLAFGTLVVAPGVSPRDEGIAGLDAVARHLWPAAWGSARERRRLTGQLAAMPEKGHVVLRLPPGAAGYEQVIVARVLSITAYLARTRPQARFTVLDPDRNSAARDLFAAHLTNAGAARVIWRAGTAGGQVLSVDASKGVLETSAGPLRADVVNFIPVMGAADIAQTAGLTDESGWCPCDSAGRSLLRPEALVLGDARLSNVRSMAAATRDGMQVGLAL